MNLYEYEAKDILSYYMLNIPKYFIIDDIKSAKKVLMFFKKNNILSWVIKAQVKAGGRGKVGGIKLSSNIDESILIIKKMLNSRLVTSQTSKSGELVKKIMITENVYTNNNNECYFSISMNRDIYSNVIIYSYCGGIDIENNDNNNIGYEILDMNNNIYNYQYRNILYKLNIINNNILRDKMLFIIKQLYNVYLNTNCLLLEINPLLIDYDRNDIYIIDTKMTLDDNARLRIVNSKGVINQKEINSIKYKLLEHKLNFVKLDGNIGCVVNGAGLAMATMDMIKYYGGKPANFFDVGGAANIKHVEVGIKLILKNKEIKLILINIFGGIVKCDIIANAIKNIFNKNKINVLFIIRLEGTNSKIANNIIKNINSSYIIHSYNLNNMVMKIKNYI